LGADAWAPLARIWAALGLIGVLALSAGCASGEGYAGAAVADPARVLSREDSAAVLACAKTFGARAGADRVTVVILDQPQEDGDTQDLARSMFEENSSDEQLVLIENVETRYVWVETGGELRRHLGADSIQGLTEAHIPDFRSGPRQGICATLADAASRINGWKRIPVAGWVAGISLPLVGAAAFVVILIRRYKLKTARHVYDINMVRLQHLEAEDAFIRVYHTRVVHSSGGSSGGGRGGSGGGRSSGGGTHF
jgi:uncharacterized membrane protein YgcG